MRKAGLTSQTQPWDVFQRKGGALVPNVAQHMVPTALGQSSLLSPGNRCVFCQSIVLMFPSGLEEKKDLKKPKKQKTKPNQTKTKQ